MTGALVLAARLGASADPVALDVKGPINPRDGAILPFNYTQGSYLMGFVFRANSAISTTQLGFYDSNLTGVAETFVSSRGGSLRHEHEPPSGFGHCAAFHPATGLFRYVSIVPLPLNTSDTYAIVGVSGTNYYTVGVQASGAPVNAAIAYVSPAY